MVCSAQAFLLFWTVLAGALPLQTPIQQQNLKPGTGSISGRVTIEGKPAVGIVVALEGDWRIPMTKMLKDTTNAEGRFQIKEIPPGTYVLRALAYAFVMRGSDRKEIIQDNRIPVI